MNNDFHVVRQSLESSMDIAARHYWSKRMSGFESAWYLGCEAVDVKDLSPKPEEHTVVCETETRNLLNNLASSGKAKFVVLLAVLAILVQKCSFTDDVTVFVPGSFDDRENKSMPFRAGLIGNMTFVQMLSETKRNLLADLSHAHCTPHIDSIYSTVGIEMTELNPRSFGIHGVDLLFRISTELPLTLTLVYNTSRYSKDMVIRTGRCYFDLLTRLLKDPDSLIGGISLISPPDPIAVRYGNTDAKRSGEPTVIEDELRETDLILPRLNTLWSEIFGDDYQIGSSENFFEAGMQSLDATRFILKIRNDFKIDISLKKLYQYSTMKTLAEYVRSCSAEGIV